MLIFLKLLFFLGELFAKCSIPTTHLRKDEGKISLKCQITNGLGLSLSTWKKSFLLLCLDSHSLANATSLQNLIKNNFSKERFLTKLEEPGVNSHWRSHQAMCAFFIQCGNMLVEDITNLTSDCTATWILIPKKHIYGLKEPKK
jgi:hypothetical protein